MNKFTFLKSKQVKGGIFVNYYGQLTDDRKHNKICVEDYDQTFTAEEICFRVAKKLEIATLAYPLFALAKKDGDKLHWFHPKEQIECNSNSAKYLWFRIRFIPSNNSINNNNNENKSGLFILKGEICRKALSYLYYQLRDDFISNRITYHTSMSEDDVYSKSLGLAVVDKIIYGKEKNYSQGNLLKVPSRQFIPENYKPKFEGFMGSLKLENNFKPYLDEEFNKYKDKDIIFIQRIYIDALLVYCENYGAEEFKFGSGQDEVTMVTVKPFDSKHPGIKITSSVEGESFFHSRIEDLMDVSINDLPGNNSLKIIHINRKQGQPLVVKCDDENKALSLVALLDGYFRLMEDYMQTLCSSVQMQFVDDLKVLKCHGPVSKSWAKQRLSERHKMDSRRNHLLKLSQEKLGTFILIHLDSKGNEHFCRIDHDGDSKKYFVVPSESSDLSFDNPRLEFDSMAKLLEHYKQPIPIGFGLNAIVPPSNPLEPNIYLCRNVKLCAERDMVVGGRVQEAVISIISSIDLKNKIGEGRYTEVYRSHLMLQDVAVKRLKQNHAQYLHHFCNLVHKSSFVGPCNTIVSILAVCLMSPVTMVMEYAPFGDFASFLRLRERQTTGLQILSATEQIAQAVYHLQEVMREVHGNIRCKNILVFKFEDSKLPIVKLADPGINPSISDHYIDDTSSPWLAPECRMTNTLSLESDRYAFGVTIWEMYSYGRSPNDLKASTTNFKGELVLPRPDSCPDEIYSIMTGCWDLNPDQRVNIKDILRDIRQHSNKVGGSMYKIYNEITKVDENHVTNGGRMAPHLDSTSTDSRAPLIRWSSDRISLIHSISKDSHVSTDTCVTHVPFNSGGCGNISKFQLKVEFSSKPLGQGHYGEVYKGEYSDDHGRVRQVAVKCLKKSMYYKYYKEFEKEYTIMESLRHKNVVQVIGRCIEMFEESPQVLVLEFVENGCLRDYLKKFKDSLKINHLLDFGYEIAQGMLYLASLKIVHRDLAARNVLVTGDQHMKIADFGLSRALSPDRNYYKGDGNKELPAPWCAPESLMQHQFTEKTDVWSYGITFWEILSYGASPQFCEVQDLLVKLHGGTRLGQPKNCPLQVYNFIKFHCWDFYDKNRNDFHRIVHDYKETLIHL